MQQQHFNVVALLLLLLITPCLAKAQKKELSQAQAYIKSGKDLDKAEKLMTDLLAKDSANRTNKKIFLTWYDAVRKQYDQANERLYLKQKQDTAAFFVITRKLFTILETLDSVEMRPDKKGRVDIEYRERHSERLTALRPNLYNGGIYFVRHNEWNQALTFFETYIDCQRQPLFTGYDFEKTDSRMAEAAYWATFCGYSMHDPVVTLRHRNLALRDSAKASFTLMYMAEARQWLNDSELYLQTLQQGFERYPTFYYFFPRLMDEYNSRRDYEKALSTADAALNADSTSLLYLFAKSTVLLSLQRYEQSISFCNRLISMNDTLAAAYLNAGTAYMNLALQLDPRKDKKQLRTTYQKARTYMERYRQLAPHDKEKWAPALYRIYLNLNMGKQFDEIDRLLKK